MMTKKDSEALAAKLRPVLNGPVGGPGQLADDIMSALIRFLGTQNPKFDEQKFREALREENVK